MSLPQLKPASSPSPLDALAARLDRDMGEVNRIILARMDSRVPMIPKLAGHLISAGGKRIRPLLTLASAALFGCDNGRSPRLAAAVEFIHTATLLHDDVVDASDQRRGRPSANALFGNEASVLVGDFLFSRSFQLMVEDGSLEVLRILSDASAVIAEGEVLQLSTANDTGMTEARYIEIIRCKTAALFAAACEVGAVVADRSPEDCAALRAYGTALGVAFQISDDVLDYAANEVRLGKSLGDDFREGKITLPVIKAVARATPAERAFWSRCMKKESQDADFAEALSIMRKHKAFDAALADARTFAEEGREALSTLPDTPVRRELSDLLAFAVERDY